MLARDYRNFFGEVDRKVMKTTLTLILAINSPWVLLYKNISNNQTTWLQLYSFASVYKLILSKTYFDLPQFCPVAILQIDA